MVSLVVNLAELSSLPDTLTNGSVVRVKLRTAAVLGVWTATELRAGGQVLPDRDNVEVEGRSSNGMIVARRVVVDAQEGGGDQAIEPRNGSWTRPSGLRCGVVARRDDAAASWPRGGATPPAPRSAAQSGA